MQAEGGVVCATVLVVLFFLRLPRLVTAKRTKQLSEVSLEERKRFDGLILFACFSLYVASFGVCVAGMSVSLSFYVCLSISRSFCLFFFHSLSDIRVHNFSNYFPGATKIIPLYKDTPNNTTIVCDPEFYDFYYHAKIAQLVVFMPYAAYNLITWLLLLGTQNECTSSLSKLLWNFLCKRILWASVISHFTFPQQVLFSSLINS